MLRLANESMAEQIMNLYIFIVGCNGPFRRNDMRNWRPLCTVKHSIRIHVSDDGNKVAAVSTESMKVSGC